MKQLQMLAFTLCCSFFFLTIIIPRVHLNCVQLHLYVLRNKEETLVSRSFPFLVVSNLKLVEEIDQMLGSWIFSLTWVFISHFYAPHFVKFLIFWVHWLTKATFLWWLHAFRHSLLLLNLYTPCNVPFWVRLFPNSFVKEDSIYL